MNGSASSPFASPPHLPDVRPIRLTPLSPQDQQRLWLRLEHRAQELAELAELNAESHQVLSDQLDQWLADCETLVRALSRQR